MLKFSYWYLFDRCYSLPLFNAKVYAYVDYHPDVQKIDPAFNPEVRRTIEHLASYVLK